MVHEDELRAIFSVLRSRTSPPGSSSAADLIRRSRARRRNDAVMGSVIATAGILVLALALQPVTPSTPVDPGPSLQAPTSTSNSVLTTPNGPPGSYRTTPSFPFTTTGMAPPAT
ncbi:hypothetical protein OG205_10300 [Lentzea sp. NBC_00516]|uniref:hypothetical protein n=1 Tax=Lentzea sp. NBC_00516 TaxID=2903582 RepID=UPI002E81343F|nr:hypothetical protein [Lentzea sp. NBC_00516]WUD27363.1 hypothetical protein OG205_10300 [Lentzea sp. NBC_00516]